MQYEQRTFFSHSLERDMTYRIYGTGGKPCLVFPSQDGHYYDFETFQMTDIAEPYLKLSLIHIQMCIRDSYNAIELGENLCEMMKRKYGNYPNFHIVNVYKRGL